MNLIEHELKGTTKSISSAFNFNFILSIKRHIQLYTSLYDKRDDLYLHIQNLVFVNQVRSI